MYTYEQLYDRIKGKPFKPVRIITRSGEIYDLHLRNQVMVSRQFVMIGIATSEPWEFFDYMIDVHIPEIVEMVDLPEDQPARSNIVVQGKAVA